MVLTGTAKFTLPLIPAWILGELADKVIQNRTGLADADRHGLLWWLGGGLIAIAVLEAVVVYIRGVTTSNVTAAMAFDIRQDLWRHMQRLSLGFHRSRPTGSLLSRLISDISVSQQMVNGGIVNVVIDAFSGGFALAMLLTINWKLTLLTLAVLPFYMVLYRRLNPRLRDISDSVQEQMSVMSGRVVERLSGIAVVQSFAREKVESERFAEYSDDLRDLNVRRGKVNMVLQSSSDFLVAMGTSLVWIVGAYIAVGGAMSTGDIIKFTLVMAQLYLPIRRFSEINFIYQTSMAAIERIFALFDVVPEVQERPNVADRTPGMGGLEFRSVSFRYGEGPMVLKNISFSLSPGERVAVVGESGAGKSTLVTLIPRLYDVTEGVVLVDGLDVRDYPFRRLRRSIGMVLQDTILFSGTIRENLRYARKRATEQDIIRAAQVANADEFIRELAEGYETMIGERGMTLSGGQRQRLSLARTILLNPRILILDEATSSLDSESENLIVDAMQRVMAGRTCIIIAHRLSTVMGVDRILVLREGCLVEQGPHEELLAAGGYYRYLFEQQFGPLQDLLSRNNPKED